MSYTGPRYLVEVWGFRYVYRTLTRREYHAAVYQSKDRFEFEERVLRAALLDWPRESEPRASGLKLLPDGSPDWDHSLAGLVSRLCAAILETSGYEGDGGLELLATQGSEWASTEEARYDALICFALNLSPEALEDLPPEIYARYAALAQSVVVGLYGITPDALRAFVDPAYAEQLARRQQHQQQRAQSVNQSTAEAYHVLGQGWKQPKNAPLLEAEGGYEFLRGS